MAVREFDGVNDVIECAVGGCTAIGAGPNTIAWVVKLAAQDGGPVWFGPAAGSGAGDVRLNPTAFGGSWFASTNGANYQNLGVAAPEGAWTLVAYTKAAGSAVPRGHLYNFDTDTWSHEDAGGAQGDATAAAEVIRFGRIAGDVNDFLAGRLAVAGAWDTVLSDGDIETLTTGTAAWAALNPVGLWELTQDDVGDPVLDLTGGDADQTAITGTTVAADDDPPDFEFGLSAPPNDAVVAGVLPLLASALTGDARNDAALAGTLPLLAAALTADARNDAALAGLLPRLAANLAGDARNDAALAGVLPMLQAQLFEDQAAGRGPRSTSRTPLGRDISRTPLGRAVA